MTEDEVRRRANLFACQLVKQWWNNPCNIPDDIPTDQLEIFFVEIKAIMTLLQSRSKGGAS